jgi:hypothetical protein
VAKKSGKSFSKHYNGSKGSDGASRSSESSNWNSWSESNSGGNGGARIRRHKNEGGGEMIAKANDSNTQSGKNHLHYYQDKDGQRTCKDKNTGTRYISEDFGIAIRNFFGW